MKPSTGRPRLTLGFCASILCVGLVLPGFATAEKLTNTYDALNRLTRVQSDNGTVIEYAYDNAGNRTSRTVTVVNRPPIANAGPDQTVRQGSLVTLNGSASTDPDNGPSPLTFAWTQTAGTNVSLTGLATANPKFTPSVKGSYTFGLVVNDGVSDSPIASINVVVPTLGAPHYPHLFAACKSMGCLPR